MAIISIIFSSWPIPISVEKVPSCVGIAASSSVGLNIRIFVSGEVFTDISICLSSVICSSVGLSIVKNSPDEGVGVGSSIDILLTSPGLIFFVD